MVESYKEKSFTEQAPEVGPRNNEKDLKCLFDFEFN